MARILVLDHAAHLEFLRTLLDLAAERDLARLLEKLCEAAFATVGCEHAAVGILGDDEGPLKSFLALSSPGGDGPASVLPVAAPTAGALAELIPERRPLRKADLERELPELGLPGDHPRVRSLLGVPIASRETIYGWLYLMGKRGEAAFGDEDERIVALLAAQAAAAYENALLIEAIRGRAAELEAEVVERRRAEEDILERERLARMTAEVSLALTRGGPLKEALQRCVGAIVDHLGFAVARIWTLDARAAVLELKASAGEHEDTDAQYARIPVGRSLTGTVASTRRALLVDDVPRSPLTMDPGYARRMGLVSFAGHPLLVGEELLGVIGTFARRPLSAATNQALAAIADAVALGVKRKLVEAQQAALEQQLRQAQKMEAVGRLAGGIAHDFNNLLAAITGYCDIVLWGIRDADPVRQDVEEIKAAAFRAAALTRQLLIVSRQQVASPRILDLNGVVAGMEKLLRRLIGEDIALAVRVDPDLGLVSADAGQVEQVIMNLAVNARDAMPRGGSLRIETRNVELDERSASLHPDARPGRYAVLSVTDGGSGMGPDVLAHLFEPFFTTKEIGKGTGLGLSTVHGIAKQSGGHITVESTLGRGSTFRVHFPHAQPGAVIAARDIAPSGAPPRGRETVLLVEDDDTLRELAQRVLGSFGYRVLAARSGPDALDIAARHVGAIDLLLTDVVMPGINGHELASRLRFSRPATRVLYMSGYTGGIALAELAKGGGRLLEKPFTPDGLARRVRETLDAPSEVKQHT